MDQIDNQIFMQSQHIAAQPVAHIPQKVGLSETHCWRRIPRMKASGVIREQSALLDSIVNAAAMVVFVAVRNDQHTAERSHDFIEMIATTTEVVEFYRISGELDYSLRVTVTDTMAYNTFYRKLTVNVQRTNASTPLTVEEIKYNKGLPFPRFEDDV